MIKIIKEGTRQIRECRNCGCKFSFDVEDVIHNYKFHAFDGITESRIICCPQCKTVIHLERSK